ncbi:unnamed protein product, partial [Rotaria magnacalcarata]
KLTNDSAGDVQDEVAVFVDEDGNESTLTSINKVNNLKT